MNLGIEEIVEVWFIPANHAYAPRILLTLASIDAAREYINSVAPKFLGELAMVRVTIKRQRAA